MKLKSLLDKKRKNHFYIMHLSYNGAQRERLWNYSKAHNIIGISHRKIFKYDWVKAPKARNFISGLWAKQLDTFCFEIENDDIVVIMDGWNSVLGIAEDLGDYKYRPELARFHPYNGDFFCYTRQVGNWVKRYNYGDGYQLKSQLIGFNNTISKLDDGGKWWTSLITTEF